MLALIALTASVGGFSAWSHRALSSQIRSTKDDILQAVAGRVREIGPVEAQEQALKAQAVQRATERRTRPALLNL